MVQKNSKKRGIQDYIADYTTSENAIKIIKSSDVVNEKGFDLWSFKKLILLEYYIKPYLAILMNRGYSCFFIDLFSSCGANKVEGKDIVAIGSSIVSLLKGVIPNKSKNRNNRFEKWFFIEYEKELCKALKSRVIEASKIIQKEFGENLEVDKDIKILFGDCNKKIDKVIQEINKIAQDKKIAVLAFIDPYTFSNIKWKTWEKLLSLTYIDIIFTNPISTIKRGIDLCTDKGEYLPPSLIDSCKTSINKIPEDKFSELYADAIVNKVNRAINFYEKGIRVTNTKNAELYRIELFTHSEPAATLTLDIAKKLNNISAQDLKNIVDKVYGKQKSLDGFGFC